MLPQTTTLSQTSKSWGEHQRYSRRHNHKRQGCENSLTKVGLLKVRWRWRGKLVKAILEPNLSASTAPPSVSFPKHVSTDLKNAMFPFLNQLLSLLGVLLRDKFTKRYIHLLLFQLLSVLPKVLDYINFSEFFITFSPTFSEDPTLPGNPSLQSSRRQFNLCLHQDF